MKDSTLTSIPSRNTFLNCSGMTLSFNLEDAHGHSSLNPLRATSKSTTSRRENATSSRHRSEPFFSTAQIIPNLLPLGTPHFVNRMRQFQSPIGNWQHWDWHPWHGHCPVSDGQKTSSFSWRGLYQTDVPGVNENRPPILHFRF